MQWILVLMIYGGDPSTMSLTSISGFETLEACVVTGEAWKRTKVSLDRDYNCLPAKAK